MAIHMKNMQGRQQGHFLMTDYFESETKIDIQVKTTEVSVLFTPSCGEEIRKANTPRLPD